MLEVQMAPETAQSPESFVSQTFPVSDFLAQIEEMQLSEEEVQWELAEHALFVGDVQTLLVQVDPVILQSDESPESHCDPGLDFGAQVPEMQLSEEERQ